jgi:hypothetical protein
MHIIFSSQIAGAGLAQGGPAYFDWGMTNYAEDTVTAVSMPAVDSYNTDGKIDDVSNLAGAPVKVIAGGDDYVIPATLPA